MIKKYLLVSSERQSTFQLILKINVSIKLLRVSSFYISVQVINKNILLTKAPPTKNKF